MDAYREFALVYDALMQDAERERWVEYINKLLGDGEKRIADCACGTGEISIGLSKLGHRVTGIDISESMLAQAAEKVRRTGLGAEIPLVCQDMRTFRLHRQMDAVISTCDGVNYLTSSKDMGMFFNAAYAALKPGGLLLFDISSRYKLQSILGNNTFTLDEEDNAYIWRNTYDEKTKLIAMELTFFAREKDGSFRRFKEEHIQRAHEQNEIESDLLESGFKDICVYDAFTLDAPSPQAQRLQFAAVK